MGFEMINIKPAKDLFADLSFILKLIVLILCCACAYFVDVHGLCCYLPWSRTSEETVEVAIYGYIVVIGVMIIIYIFGKPQKLFEGLMLLVGGSLSLAAGIVSLMAYHDFDNYRRDTPPCGHWGTEPRAYPLERLVVAIVALINAVIMLFDGVVSTLMAFHIDVM